MTAVQVRIVITGADTIQPIMPGHGRGVVAVNKNVELVVENSDQAARLAGHLRDLAELLLNRDGVTNG